MSVIDIICEVFRINREHMPHSGPFSRHLASKVRTNNQYDRELLPQPSSVCGKTIKWKVHGKRESFIDEYGDAYPSMISKTILTQHNVES